MIRKTFVCRRSSVFLLTLAYFYAKNVDRKIIFNRIINMEENRNKFIVTAKVKSLLVTDSFASCILRIKKIQHLQKIMVKRRSRGDLREEKTISKRFLFPKEIEYRVYNNKENIHKIFSYYQLTYLQVGKTYEFKFEFAGFDGDEEILLLHDVKDLPLRLENVLDLIRNRADIMQRYC